MMSTMNSVIYGNHNIASKSQSEESILHAVKKIDVKFDYIVFPQVTTPLRPKNIFDKSLKYFFKYNFDSLFSSNIPTKIFLWDKFNKKLVPKYNIYKRLMREDIKDTYLENGSFYIFKKKGFIKSKNRLFGKIGMYIVHKEYSYDIDNEVDFQINTIIKKKLKK